MSAKIMPAGPDAYACAAALLHAGALVALPTETVYGLAGDARSDAAIETIYAVKGRPSHNPLITHLPRPEDAVYYADIPDLATTLMAQFWPGPLTLVMPRRTSDLAERASAGLDTIALRCPDAPWREGLATAGWAHPLVMPSANVSGHVSPTIAAHVMRDLGDRIDLIIDGGPCRRGVESTVLSVIGGKAVLLRDGAIAREDIEQLTGPLFQATSEQPIASPGMLDRHYAPEATLRLNAEGAQDGEIFISFGAASGFVPASGAASPTLSVSGDLEEAARNLYRVLRDLDGPGVRLAIAPIPNQGLGRALNDRLRRAALGR